MDSEKLLGSIGVLTNAGSKNSSSVLLPKEGLLKLMWREEAEATQSLVVVDLDVFDVFFLEEICFVLFGICAF